MQSVAPSIEDIDSLLQWSADTTEHAHIEVIKNPANASNNKDYDTQICRFLDRHKKCRLFDDATTLLLAGDHDRNTDMENEDPEELDDETAELEESCPMAVLADLWGPIHQATNFFKKAEHAIKAGPSKIWPPCSFVACSTAIHLNYDPSCKSIAIDDAAVQFFLPDLHGALADYFACEGQSLCHFPNIGQARCAAADTSLPFDRLQIWFKVQMQQQSFHDDSIICPAFTVNVSPPDGHWKYGHYDVVGFAVEEAHKWPRSGLRGAEYMNLFN